MKDFYLEISLVTTILFYFHVYDVFLPLQRTGFEIGAFESYPKSFRDDSIMELPQAGTYQGASDIKEYVKFAYAGTSPYIACCNDYTKRQVKFVGYYNGQCEFVTFYARNFQLLPKHHYCYAIGTIRNGYRTQSIFGF